MPMGIVVHRLKMATANQRLPRKARPKKLPRLPVKVATAPARVVRRHLHKFFLAGHHFPATRDTIAIVMILSRWASSASKAAVYDGVVKTSIYCVVCPVAIRGHTTYV